MTLHKININLSIHLGVSPNMIYEVSNKELILRFYPKNKGKFRFKKRSNISIFGKTYKTTENPFTDKVYLEWQVGYDTLPKDIEKKPTKLEHLTFVGANNKVKHPYELSELFWDAIRIGLIEKSQVLNLIDEIKYTNKMFNEEFKIEILETYEEKYNEEIFVRGDIVLPSFFLKGKNNNTYLEVAIKQQQYASGIQPMVYITIPILEFENASEALGLNSNHVDNFTYIINENNVDLLLSAFKIFGMCSESHKHDSLMILNALLSDF